jgi:hypothetical protein
VQIFRSLDDVLSESLSLSPMDMDVGDDMILGWDWISSYDLHHLYVDGQVSLRSGASVLLQLDLLSASARPAGRLLPVIVHGEFRRLLCQIAREIPVACASSPPSQRPTPLPTPSRSTGWSRPVFAEHAELAAAEAAQLPAARRRPGRPVELRRCSNRSTTSPQEWRCSRTARNFTSRHSAWPTLSCTSPEPIILRSLFQG